MTDASRLKVLTPEDRRRNTAKSIEMRREWASVKEQIRSGELSLESLFLRAMENDTLGRMRVGALVRSWPTVGPARAEKIMAEARVAPGRRLRGLGSRQRDALIRAHGAVLASKKGHDATA
jgi:hypothetical protein